MQLSASLSLAVRFRQSMRAEPPLPHMECTEQVVSPVKA